MALEAPLRNVARLRAREARAAARASAFVVALALPADSRHLRGRCRGKSPGRATTARTLSSHCIRTTEGWSGCIYTRRVRGERHRLRIRTCRDGILDVCAPLRAANRGRIEKRLPRGCHELVRSCTRERACSGPWSWRYTNAGNIRSTTCDELQPRAAEPSLPRIHRVSQRSRAVGEGRGSAVGYRRAIAQLDNGRS